MNQLQIKITPVEAVQQWFLLDCTALSKPQDDRSTTFNRLYSDEVDCFVCECVCVFLCACVCVCVHVWRCVNAK